LFAVPTGVRSVVYVIDRSGSMGEMGRLPLARRELAASLQGLPDSVGFQVIVYNRRAVTLPMAGRAGLVPATAGNVARALQFLESLVPEGGTAHREALKQALKLQPEVLFFLTDADDLKPEDVMVLTGMNRGKTAIHVVELGPGHRNPEALPMHRLARSNGGTYRAVDVSH
jgi:Ca-activated chloride channel family protein